MSDVSNLRDTIVPKSNQLNSEQLLYGPLTITVTSVARGSDDQPITVHYRGENGRPYLPCKSMRKVLIFAWGEDGNKWVGRSMTLFNDLAVKWAGVAVGGIRISHMTHIDREISLQLTATRGKKEPFIIKMLTPPADDRVEKFRAALTKKAGEGLAAIVDAWGKTPDDIKAALGGDFYKDVTADITADVTEEE
jgi:hypothetical protein